MRDKLIEILKQIDFEYGDEFVGMFEDGYKGAPPMAEFFADHLIANNVFVLPEQMKDSWELALPFMARLFVADEAEIESIKREFEIQKVKQILTDIRDYLVAIIVEWHKRIDEPNFLENNIMVYNHIRKELDDLTEYAERLGVEL